MSEWISVKDRLPEEDADVLFKFEHNMAVGFLRDTNKNRLFWCAYDQDGHYNDCYCNPTHWMPLPEPPKEAQE